MSVIWMTTAVSSVVHYAFFSLNLISDSVRLNECEWDDEWTGQRGEWLNDCWQWCWSAIMRSQKYPTNEKCGQWAFCVCQGRCWSNDWLIRWWRVNIKSSWRWRYAYTNHNHFPTFKLYLWENFPALSSWRIPDSSAGLVAHLRVARTSPHLWFTFRRSWQKCKLIQFIKARAATTWNVWRPTEPGRPSRPYAYADVCAYLYIW